MTHRWILRFGLFLADVALLEAAFFGVYWWRFQTGMFRNPVDFSSGELLIPSAIVTLYWVLAFAWFGLYRFDPLQSRAQALLDAFKAAGIGILILFILTFDPSQPLPRTRVILASYGIAIFIIVGGNRVTLLTVLRELRVRGIGVLRTLMIGSGRQAQHVLRHLALHPELGLRVRCALTASDASVVEIGAPPVAGTFSQLRSVLQSQSIRAVVFAPESEDEGKIARLLKILREFRVRSFISAEQYPVLVGEVKPTHVYGHPLVEIRPEVLSIVERFLKRTTDIIFALLILVASLPLCLSLAILIALESRGGVIFRQERVGLGGRIFTLYKFRSMQEHAESGTGAVLAVEGDPRVTRIGRWMRPLRLDELPQLFNVLLGQMSLVGPRPERIEFVEEFIRDIPLYERRLNVKPGLTGWSQVHLRYDRSADQIPIKLKYDFYYIENMSLPLDVKIMFMTLFVMLRGEGI